MRMRARSYTWRHVAGAALIVAGMCLVTSLDAPREEQLLWVAMYAHAHDSYMRALCGHPIRHMRLGAAPCAGMQIPYSAVCTHVILSRDRLHMHYISIYIYIYIYIYIMLTPMLAVISLAPSSRLRCWRRNGLRGTQLTSSSSARGRRVCVGQANVLDHV